MGSSARTSGGSEEANGAGFSSSTACISAAALPRVNGRLPVSIS
jgi:hypothetical protein